MSERPKAAQNDALLRQQAFRTGQAEARVTQAEHLLAVAVEALRWYAEAYLAGQLLSDRGERAQAALSEIEEERS